LCYWDRALFHSKTAATSFAPLYWESVHRSQHKCQQIAHFTNNLVKIWMINKSMKCISSITTQQNINVTKYLTDNDSYLTKALKNIIIVIYMYNAYMKSISIGKHAHLSSVIWNTVIQLETFTVVWSADYIT
jgi:hypothetical protein